jgi:hypothetical protein
MISLVVACSVSARASIAARSSGSILTGTTSAGSYRQILWMGSGLLGGVP